MVHQIKLCGEDQLSEIRAIYNEVIAHSTALYYYQPRTRDEMKDWFVSKGQNNFPVLGAFDRDETLLGFATYGPFRNWPAYQFTVEHSVYIKSDMRGKGLGEALLKAIIEHVRARNFHVLIGGVDGSNTVSARLHEKLGFQYCGTIKHAGYKFDQWLDLAFYQLVLESPNLPMGHSNQYTS